LTRTCVSRGLDLTIEGQSIALQYANGSPQARRTLPCQLATLGPPGTSPWPPAQAQFLTAPESLPLPVTSLSTQAGDVDK
jgi:hypothetical protein